MCDHISEGRIAIIGIGDTTVLSHIQLIASSLNIPYLSVKWNSLNEELNTLAKLESDPNLELNEVALYPPTQMITESIIDLINHYGWDHVTILYQELTGLDKIEDLIRLPYKTTSSKLRLHVKQLGIDVNQWIYSLKDVKLSGSSHIIVDVQTKYLNTFLEYVKRFFFVMLIILK